MRWWITLYNLCFIFR